MFLLVFAGAFLGSWLLGHAVHAFLRKYRILDLPNSRSSHSHAVIRGGGIAIIVTILCCGWGIASQENDPFLRQFLILALILALVSVADDIRGLSVRSRLTLHFLVALCFLLALPDQQWAIGILDPTSECFSVCAWVLGVFWLVGHLNAFNFMDGINGIAASQATVTSLGMAFITIAATGQTNATPIGLCFAMAGASLGFLPHNFPRARMFMGDVGSAPLGFLLAGTLLLLANLSEPVLLIPLFLVHANFVFDTTITLLRRIINRENLAEPHREHFYQRLIRAGYSHTVVTSAVMFLQVITIGLALFFTIRGNCIGWMAGSILVVWGFFFAWCDLAFKKTLRARLAS